MVGRQHHAARVYTFLKTGACRPPLYIPHHQAQCHTQSTALETHRPLWRVRPSDRVQHVHAWCALSHSSHHQPHPIITIHTNNTIPILYVLPMA